MSAQQPDGVYRGRALECDVCGSTPDVFVAEIIGGFAYREMGMRCNDCADELPTWYGQVFPDGYEPVQVAP